LGHPEGRIFIPDYIFPQGFQGTPEGEKIPKFGSVGTGIIGIPQMIKDTQPKPGFYLFKLVKTPRFSGYNLLGFNKKEDVPLGHKKIQIFGYVFVETQPDPPELGGKGGISLGAFSPGKGQGYGRRPNRG
jgi:hypothetical protein